MSCSVSKGPGKDEAEQDVRNRGRKNGRKERREDVADKPSQSNWEVLRAKGGLSKQRGSKKTRRPRAPEKDAVVMGSLTKTLALDCEMVGAGVGGSESLLARVSIVNSNGQVVYDTYVSPSRCVTDYRTQYSGIQPHHLKGAPTKNEVLSKVRSLVAGRILLGHAIHNDLEVLELRHPETHVRDSSKYPDFMRRLPNGKLRPKKLSLLAEEELNLKIQNSTAGHCSVQDARTVLALYKKHEGPFEKWWHRQFREGHR